MNLSMEDFRHNGMMLRYSIFVPRLYNFCKSIGLEPGKIMPSRALLPPTGTARTPIMAKTW